VFAYIFARLSWRPIFTSAIFRRGTVFTAICLCVCLLAVQLKRFWVDFYEIFVSGNRLDFGSDPKYILGILSYSQIVQSPVDWEDQLQCSAGNGWGGITVRIWVRRGGGMHFSECRLVLTVPKRTSTRVNVRCRTLTRVNVRWRAQCEWAFTTARPNSMADAVGFCICSSCLYTNMNQ